MANDVATGRFRIAWGRIEPLAEDSICGPCDIGPTAKAAWAKKKSACKNSFTGLQKTEALFPCVWRIAQARRNEPVRLHGYQ